MLSDSVVVVGTTPTLLCNPGTNQHADSITWVQVHNGSAVTLYLGGPSVSTTTGTPVATGTDWAATLGNGDSLYGVVAAATQNIVVLKSRQ